MISIIWRSLSELRPPRAGISRPVTLAGSDLLRPAEMSSSSSRSEELRVKALVVRSTPRPSIPLPRGPWQTAQVDLKAPLAGDRIPSDSATCRATTRKRGGLAAIGAPLCATRRQARAPGCGERVKAERKAKRHRASRRAGQGPKRHAGARYGRQSQTVRLAAALRIRASLHAPILGQPRG